MVACAFYNLVLIILPFDPAGTTDEFNTLLKRASADVLVTQGGQLSLDEFLGAGLKEIVLVIEKASQHLGWGETSGVTKRVQYDEIVKETVEPIADLDIDLDAPAVVIFGPKVLDEIDMVEFSHRVGCALWLIVHVLILCRISLLALPLRRLYCPRPRSTLPMTYLSPSTPSRTCTLASTPMLPFPPDLLSS